MGVDIWIFLSQGVWFGWCGRCGPGCKYALHELPSFQIEWNLELVRRILYPELPSRCQSIFCLNSVEEFQNWPELMVGEGQLVEILAPDNGKYAADLLIRRCCVEASSCLTMAP